MIKVSIVGASGYSGIYLAYTLLLRKDVELVHITSQSNAGKEISEVFPSFSKMNGCGCSVNFEKLDEKLIAASSDVVFLCLPHGKSSSIVSSILKLNPLIKIIDIGADFRFDRLENYELNYEKHAAPDLNKYFVYGLADVYEDKIKGVQFVSNPGCYPTGALLPLLPLIKAGIINFNSPVIIDSKSGISGAGRSSANISNLFCEAQNSVRAYNLWKHRHLPEIKEKICNEMLTGGYKSACGNGKSDGYKPSIYDEPAYLHKHEAEPAEIQRKYEQTHSEENYPEIIFTPHIIPVIRGILTTIYIKLNSIAISENAIEDIYNNFYKNSPFVVLLKNGILPDIKNVIYSNVCHISFSKNGAYLILVSAIDNLGKGASLQAVQNMNLMFGLPADYEIRDFTPYP
ncbi:MAG: N-acetyl-gamma-glutamyl-phosphate reductase [Candidatus Acididesulfobacter guangdongensis]|uniref:N-acetyl-gamma-glutamyl-phosphate reductase n=1 Tax=Acididesulfobacter guangdongensis TaxID=2597225 RepID=A0A519BHU9_ACIG2|nr:MAG: N-acetyl-gamma-glutamyl-phosphate reductase [Candidatus Acididesulfobacter guangdongensis]